MLNKFDAVYIPLKFDAISVLMPKTLCCLNHFDAKDNLISTQCNANIYLMPILILCPKPFCAKHFDA